MYTYHYSKHVAGQIFMRIGPTHRYLNFDKWITNLFITRFTTVCRKIQFLYMHVAMYIKLTASKRKRKIGQVSLQYGDQVCPFWAKQYQNEFDRHC